MRAFLALVLAMASTLAHAQTYRCTGKDGKKYYGQSVPAQCAGATVEQLNSQGMVVRSINPEFESRQRALEMRNAAEAQERAEKDRRELERTEFSRPEPSPARSPRESRAEPEGLSESEPAEARESLERPERPDRPDRPDSRNTSPLRGRR